MKRLTILAIIACVGLLVGSAAVVGGPGGPPGGLDVSVVNPVPLPVTVEQHTLFQGIMSVSKYSGEDPVLTPLNPAPEAGKILVIEHISGYCAVNGGDPSFFAPAIKTSFEGLELTHFLMRELAHTPNNTSTSNAVYVFSQKTMILADTDDPIEAYYYFGYSGSAAPDVGCSYRISGFLRNSQ